MYLMKLMSGMIIFFISSSIYQTSALAQDNLSNYIKEGLANNLIIKQKNISLEKAIYSLKTANSYFLPSINLIGEYTSGEGGRRIDLPVGDLLNPVYSTLNQLINSSAFPQIKNVSESLSPNNFYDIKIRATVPVFNIDLFYNQQIQSMQVQLKDFEIEIYKKELIKEIKVAYYSYISSLEVIKIFKSSEHLAREAKKMYESLLKNGSVLPVYLLRAESEIENSLSKITDAENQSGIARKYFNFLINKDLDSDILVDSAINNNDTFNNIPELNSSLDTREEILAMNKGLELNKKVLEMNEYYWLPKINFFLDLGTQEKNWKINSDSKYYLLGLRLNVPLYEGSRNQYKISEAELNIRNTELELENTKKQFALAQSIALSDVRTAFQNYQSSLKQLNVSESYYSLTHKGYKEGVNTFLETVDARNQLISARLLVNINKYQILIALAKYEREVSVKSNIY